MESPWSLENITMVASPRRSSVVRRELFAEEERIVEGSGEAKQKIQALMAEMAALEKRSSSHRKFVRPSPPFRCRCEACGYEPLALEPQGDLAGD